MVSTDTRRQIIKYALVGLGSNIVLYGGYLLLTQAGLGHKTAMTLLYLIGVLQTFLFNRRWTFRYRGGLSGPLFRYIAAYGFGYFFNLALLALLVDGLGLPHQIVQGLLILVVAGLLFLLQKYWVFPEQCLIKSHMASVAKPYEL